MPEDVRRLNGKDLHWMQDVPHAVTGEMYVLVSGESGSYVLSRAQWQTLPAPEKVPAADYAARKQEILKQYYGYSSFRTGQEGLVDSILSGRDTLGVMPTGAGKSICFQVPALILPGVSIVVSPLISLMKDQVNALTQSGIPAAYLNSSLTEVQYQRALRNAEAGKYKILYVAPERLLTERFLAFSRSADISMLAVDEAHCISQWGQDFRPSYLAIPDYIEQLPVRPVVAAFTATATDKVRTDIKNILRLKDPMEYVSGFDRGNLYFQVLRGKKREDMLFTLMQRYQGLSGIVYCATRKNVEQVTQALIEKGYPATRYHAGLSDEERSRNQEDFIYDRRPVMVATSAFGMGIDKPDVRFVIHYNMPKDLESYYQEAGRAGRDGENSECILLFSPQDIMTQKFLIEKMEGDGDPASAAVARQNALKRLEQMVQYCKTGTCLRRYILGYFGEDAPEKCDNCGSCLSPVTLSDATDVSRVILGAVLSTHQRYGAGTLIGMLRGSASEAIRRFSLDASPSYGLLKHMSRPLVNDVIFQLTEEGYLASEGDQYPVLKLTDAGRSALTGENRIFLRLDLTAQASGTKESRRKEKRTRVSAGSSDSLYEALRSLRTRLARDLGLPAYMIFSDATLKALAAARPTTREEMLQVSGIGQKKLDQYGDTFLEELRSR